MTDDAIYPHTQRTGNDHHLSCNGCGKSVSSAFVPFPTELGPNLVVRAWIECPECLEKRITTRTKEFELSETEQCALLRQLHNHHISAEGRSGPILLGTIRRLQRHIGPARYDEFVGGDWPERLKPHV